MVNSSAFFALWVKEMRQCAVPAAVAWMLAVGLRYILAPANPYSWDPIPFQVSAIILGSAFLAQENGTGAVNFLLRLPVARRLVFFSKMAAHVSLVVACATLAVLFMILFPPPERWVMYHPSASPPNYLTPIISIPLVYLIGVFVSIAFDKNLTALLAAIAVALLVILIALQLSYGVSDLWDGRPMDVMKRRDVTETIQRIVLNATLLIALIFSAGLSWWLFQTKEGR